MKQQINLFQSEFKRTRIILSLKALFMSSIGLMVGLGVIYWINAGEIKLQEAGLKKIETQVAERTVQLQTLSQKRDPGQSPKNAKTPVNRVEQLEKILEAKRQTVNQLKSIYQSDAAGFSRFLESFSKNSLDGLWLTEFSILEGGLDFEIKGKALEAELVLDFLEKLSNDTLFAENDFSTLEVVSGDNKPSRVTFIVNTGGSYN